MESDMGRSFRCVLLGENLIEQAFPLVSAHEPWLTLDTWREEAARRLVTGGREGAIVALREEFARGILLYDTVREEAGGGESVLRITAVMVSDFLFANDIAGALVEAANAQARALGCAGVAVSAFCPRDKPALRNLHVAGPVV